MRLPIALLMLLAAQGSTAQGQVPLKRTVRSLTVIEDGAAVLTEPRRDAARRGTLVLGASLKVIARAPGEGCGDAGFYQLGEAAFVCASAVRAEKTHPEPMALPDAALPYEHLSVRREGARGYARPEDAATDEYDTAYAKGFTVVARERVEHEGVAFVRTRRGHYVRARDLRPVRGSDFAGVELGERPLSSVAFVISKRASVRDDQGRALRELPRLSKLEVLGQEGERLRIAGGGLVDASATVQPSAATRPDEVAADELWVDVDLGRQVLVAYRGARPIFVTLISSGKPRRRTETPRGRFRIWVKLISSDMRDRERHELEQSYALEAVPWVQYFEGGYGFHAAFWHERFGEPMSRGCINLSPADARTLFQLTRPALPAGWEAVLPADRARSTLVVLR